MQGALNLHEARGTPCCRFLRALFIATTLFGNPGQAAYVAANLGLEALADDGAASTSGHLHRLGADPDAGYLGATNVLGALVGRMGGEALKSDDLLTVPRTPDRSSRGNRDFSISTGPP